MTNNGFEYVKQDTSMYRLFFSKDTGVTRELDTVDCMMHDAEETIQNKRVDGWKHIGTSPVMIEYSIELTEEEDSFDDTRTGTPAS
jgi:hypothetical protein